MRVACHRFSSAGRGDELLARSTAPSKSGGSAPALSVFLNSDREVGTLLILTGEDGVKVLLPSAPETQRIQALGARVVTQDLAEVSDTKRELWQKQVSVRHDPSAVARVMIELLNAHS